MNAKALFDTSPLEQVREGMTVLDAQGSRLGKVKRLRMGDPDAVTNAGQTLPGTSASNPGGASGFGGSALLTDSADDPDVPEPLLTRLRRVGFIELEDSDLHGANAYLPGDHISHVRDEMVYMAPQTTTEVQQPSRAHTGSVTNAPMLRMELGTPRYTVHPKTRLSRSRFAIAAGAGLTLGSIGAVVGFWQYRERRRRQSRLDARAQRWIASVGQSVSEREPRSLGAMAISGLVVLAVMRKLLRRSQGETALPSMVEGAGELAVRRMGISRRIPLVGLGALVIVTTILVRRGASREEKPTYIGTPGVESASGRDRVRSGDLPPEYGTEHA